MRVTLGSHYLIRISAASRLPDILSTLLTRAKPNKLLYINGQTILPLMKFAIVCCFLIIQGNVFSQSVDCNFTIDSLLKTSSGSITKESLKTIRPCIYEIQTKGFSLEEHYCKYDSARIEIERAFKVWKHINDTLNQANLLKYLGYLNGRLKNFQFGKTQIAEAIHLFGSKKNESGVAVSRYDLAQLYEYENKIDSAIALSTIALEFWKEKNDAFRIVTLNNHLINLYTKKETDAKKVKAIIAENDLLLAREKIHHLPQMNFYFVSSKYFEKVNDKDNKDKYGALYSKIINDHGNRSYSSYDERNCR